MNKEQKRKVQLQQRTLNESLAFQTMFGAKQKFESLTSEIEARLKEELLVFANLGIAKDLMTLRDAMDKVKQQFGYMAEPSKGILAGSYVAYSLGLEPSNPIETGRDIDPKDFQVALPLGLTISYDNEITAYSNLIESHQKPYTFAPLIRQTSGLAVLLFITLLEGASWLTDKSAYV